jgi:hypothetical protein
VLDASGAKENLRREFDNPPYFARRLALLIASLGSADGIEVVTACRFIVDGVRWCRQARVGGGSGSFAQIDVDRPQFPPFFSMTEVRTLWIKSKYSPFGLPLLRKYLGLNSSSEPLSCKELGCWDMPTTAKSVDGFEKLLLSSDEGYGGEGYGDARYSDEG